MSTVAVVDLIEFTLATAPASVDREAGVIRGVKLLGWQSANGRRYLPEGVDPRVYEGRQVNVNHPARPGEQRSAYDRFGRVVNVAKKDDGLYGDLHYLKSHPLAAPVAEAAERMPGLFGMSHNARGRERRDNGQAVIEAVESVVSVDLVADPATVHGLFEAKGTPMATTVKAVRESLKDKAPAYAKRLQEMEDAGVLAPEMPMAEPAEPGDSDSALKDGFKAAIIAAVDDDSLDMQGKLSKIREILKAQEKLMAPAEAPDAGASSEDEGSGGESGTTEGKQADPRDALIESLRLQVAVAGEVAAAGIKPGKVLAKALAACKDITEARELIADAKQAAGGPRSAAPAAKAEELPKSPKELREQYGR